MEGCFAAGWRSQIHRIAACNFRQSYSMCVVSLCLTLLFAVGLACLHTLCWSLPPHAGAYGYIISYSHDLCVVIEVCRPQMDQRVCACTELYEYRALFVGEVCRPQVVQRGCACTELYANRALFGV